MGRHILFIAALVAGLSYPLSPYLACREMLLPDWGPIAWKGAGVGLLAIWASSQGRTTDHRLLAAVLLFGAVADMVLDVQFMMGAVIFAVGHGIAITLYLRNRRPALGRRDMALAALFIGGTILLGSRLASPEMALPVGVYTLFLAVMAATALLSRFQVAAAGALLFLLSDLLIFARMGSLSGSGWVSPVIWLCYFAGQALIAWGVASRIGPDAAFLDFRRSRR